MRCCSMTKLPTGRSTVVRKYITRSLMAVGTMRWLRPQAWKSEASSASDQAA